MVGLSAKEKIMIVLLVIEHTILDIHLCPVSLAELCIVDVNRDLFKIWMYVGKLGGHGG
jgi:hypothetical protein